jgi:hypothetical protein
MTIGSPKYFGEPAFNGVYCKLIEKARNKQIIHYEEVAVIMGKKYEEKMGHYWANETGHMLREICEYEHKHNRPMLSAIVVLKDDGIPGKGFFELARGLEKLTSVSKQDEKTFWKQELLEVYKTWG